ncbi:synaptosomal-associated protein 29-like [Portunus trituberculatus]|uniref:synaptosomal-associated protein 29-like n=1 Tax=Portunus trituberculatus TaxID=210409 RepID=UPI001E1CD24E|nr:synaptosomal-associated protein 29-like [Portunus trituberculatus]
MASGSRKFGLDDNNSNFSFNDNDGMTREFLNTSSATYLASDKLMPGPEMEAAREAELRRQEVLRQMRDIENRTLQSTKNSKIMLSESEKVGLETAQELVKQRTSFSFGHHCDLKDTQKNINGIKSVFSSLKTWWSTPKQGSQSSNPQKESPQPGSPTDPSNTEQMLKNPHLSSAYQKSQASLVSSQQSSTHPALQLRGFDDVQNDSFTQDFRETSKKVNLQLDADLDEMSQGLSRLRGLAMGLGEEITDQNDLIDRIHGKAEKVEATIGSQNTQMKKILKR